MATEKDSLESKRAASKAVMVSACVRLLEAQMAKKRAEAELVMAEKELLAATAAYTGIGMDILQLETEQAGGPKRK